jgi:putative ABC transport system permease protein
VAGIGLSQVTSIFVANMFGVNIEKYRFVFSHQAFVKTLIYFAIIYVIVILFNMFCINKYKLIDLLTGSRKAEDTREIVKLINTTLSGVSVFVAFILGFLVIYASNFLMKKRKKEFALYILLGMGKRKISLILFLETLIIGVISAKIVGTF